MGFFLHLAKTLTVFAPVFTHVVTLVFAAKVRFDKRGKCLIENYSAFVCRPHKYLSMFAD